MKPIIATGTAAKRAKFRDYDQLDQEYSLCQALAHGSLLVPLNLQCVLCVAQGHRKQAQRGSMRPSQGTSLSYRLFGALGAPPASSLHQSLFRLTLRNVRKCKSRRTRSRGTLSSHARTLARALVEVTGKVVVAIDSSSGPS